MRLSSGPTCEQFSIPASSVEIKVSRRWLTVEMGGRGETLRQIRARLTSWLAVCDVASGAGERGLDLASARGWRVAQLVIVREVQGLPAFTSSCLAPARWVGSRGPRIPITIEASESPSPLTAWELFSAFDPTRRVDAFSFDLARRGLDLAGPDGVAFLRDPSTALAGEQLRRVWAHLTWRLRMVDPSTATRRDRCELDRRWAVIRSGAALDRGLHQLRRESGPAQLRLDLGGA